MRKKTGFIIAIVALLALNCMVLFWLVRTAGGDAHEAEPTTTTAVPTTEATEATTAETEESSEQLTPKEQAATHVYAHRGVSGESMEHSFAAYDKAIEDGAKYIEQDIVISADGTLYVSHDQNAARMTGVNRDFSGMTDGEIDALTTHSGNPVLRLSEVFDRYGTSINYVIELKSKDDATVDAFIRIVEDYQYQDQITVQCFLLDVLQRLEDRWPDMPKLYLCRSQDAMRAGLDKSYVDIISVEDWMMTQDNCDEVHDHDKQFGAWPITSEEWIRKAIDMGVDSYFTDDVAKAMEIEETYGIEKRE